MQVLSFTFRLLSCCGVWRPIEWDSRKRLCFLYRLFSNACICSIYSLIVLQIVLLSVSEFDLELMTDIFYTLLTLISVGGKVVNFIVRREKIIELADMLLHSYCLPRDREEIQMVKDINDFIRVFTIAFNGLAQMTVCCLITAPLFNTHRELPYPLWLPYDCHKETNYWLTWAGEFGGAIFAILINVTTDVLVSAFVLQACLQFDFLNHRLLQLVEIKKHSLDHYQTSKESIEDLEERVISEAILHHNYVIKFATKVTETFNYIIIQQYVASAVLLSIIVYQLSVRNTSGLQKFVAAAYFLCMITELFSYCWFGNELTLKSIQLGDDIYKLDWMFLSKKSQKNLMFIMLRTSRPIVMCYGSLIILNIESFKKILKVTYSVFNVLKESSNN